MTMIEVSTPEPYESHEMIGRLEDLYIQAKQAKSKMVDEWKRNYRVTKNKAAPAVPSGATTRANEVFPTVDSRIGWMTDQEIQFTVTPACDPYSMYSMVQETLGDQLESVLNSVMKTDGWYSEIVTMLWDSAMYGAGFLKCVWDAGLEGGQGNIALKHTSPWCIYVDPFASNLNDAQYIIEVHTMSAQEIERKFPEVSHELIRDAVMTGDTSTDHLPPNQEGNRRTARNYMGMELVPINAGQGATTWGKPGHAKNHITSRQEGVDVRECWFRENYTEEIEPADPKMGETRTVVVDQWRVIVYAGNTILLDEIAENLYHTNRHPYVRYVDVETGEFWGEPLLRDLAPCQQSMNVLLAMAQNNIVFTGNPMLIGVKNSGVERATFTNKAGGIYDVNGGAGGAQANKPSWLAPPNLPALLMDMVGFWREEMERIAGISGTQRGEVPSGRATDKQVSAGQEAGFIRIRSSLRNLELSLRKAGELLANLVVINYDTPRFCAIVGEEGNMTSMRLAAQHFYGPSVDKDNKVHFTPMRFALTVNAGSSKPTSRGARVQEANQLHQMGVVDDTFVLQAYRVSHAQDVMRRKQAEMQQKMALAEAQKQAGQAAENSGKKPGSSKGPR